MTAEVHAAWLPVKAFAAVGSRRVAVAASGLLAETVRREVAGACAHHGGTLLGAGSERPDLLLTTNAEAAGEEGFVLQRRDGTTRVEASGGRGLLYGLFHVVRLGEAAFAGERAPEHHRPATPGRMLDHWDNVDPHPVMGQVERGYAGGSIFWDRGRLRPEPARIRAYGRLLASCGVNAVAVNNVNVHAREARLLTDRLGEVAAIADLLRPYGLRVHLSVGFFSPISLGGLDTADPLDARVRAWWAAAVRRVYEAIPDFGGFVVKADSEGQPGPFAYGRTQAEGARALAEALAAFGGQLHWRAFVYDNQQDWRDRHTDRARAAFDHFRPLDGRFPTNTVLQIKNGPIDFQVREPPSPLLAAMPSTRLAAELQITQEYTGQQRHVCYLAPMWSEVLACRLGGDGSPTIADVVGGAGGGGLVGVSNAGHDPFWTGHPLAQANLYAFGRLSWQPDLQPAAILDEWIDLTFAPQRTQDPRLVRDTLHRVMDDSWRTYERYTTPLGVGFMVRPGHHYGPDVDGYEYTPWGTYHHADREGVGRDRTRATGTGFTGQYPPPWRDIYESLDQCPDEVLLFFHHVPYGHRLHSGKTVIQHIYDSHFAGFEEAREMQRRWEGLAGLIDDRVFERVRDRLDEQVRSAREWRDQVNAYFFRKSGVPDERGRTLY